MRTYQIRLIHEGQEISSGVSTGGSALEALENAFEHNTIYVPSEIFEAHVLGPSGIVFKFECGRAF